MEGSTKGKVGAAQAEEQSWNKKPFSHIVPPKPPLRASSPFPVWQKPYRMSHGDAARAAVSYPQFASASPAQAAMGNNKRVHNPTPDIPFPIPTSGTGSAISGAAVHDPTAKIDQVQAAKLVLGGNFDPNMDPKKLKRSMSNRISAQKARMRKIQYITDLEGQAKAFEDQVAALHPQLASYTNRKQFLISEQKVLNQQLVALEKEKSLKEAEIEKNKAERNMLREVQMIQEEQFRAQKFNWNTDLQPIASYPNSYPVAQNGGETSEMKVNMPQNQGQMLIHPNMDQQTPNLTLPNYAGWTRF